MVPDSIDRLRGLLLPLNEDGCKDDNLRRAAVLVLLHRSGEEVGLLLTRRPTTMNKHPGQIALPGGGEEVADESLLRTALRETGEELGIDTSDIEPLGRLPAVAVLASGYVVAPFVGWLENLPDLRPDMNEVEAVFDLPLATLLNPEVVMEEVWELRGRPWLVTFFRHEEHAIWGATARILAELAERMQVVWEGHPPGTVRPVS